MTKEANDSVENGSIGYMPLDEHGQSMTEYLIVCSAISAAIGIFMADGSLYMEFSQAIAEAYDKFSYAISLVL